jgi:cell division protein FtsL
MAANLQELITLGKVVFVLSITLIIWAWLAVGLRLWVRFRITKSPGWDDAAMVATLVSQLLPLINISLPLQLLFTIYCAFILTITMRSAQGKLFDEKDRYLSLVVRYNPTEFYRTPY